MKINEGKNYRKSVGTGIKLASFKVDQRPYRVNAVDHVDAAVLAHVSRSAQWSEGQQNPHGHPNRLK